MSYYYYYYSGYYYYYYSTPKNKKGGKGGKGGSPPGSLPSLPMNFDTSNPILPEAGGVIASLSSSSSMVACSCIAVIIALKVFGGE